MITHRIDDENAGAGARGSALLSNKTAKARFGRERPKVGIFLAVVKGDTHRSVSCSRESKTPGGRVANSLAWRLLKGVGSRETTGR